MQTEEHLVSSVHRPLSTGRENGKLRIFISYSRTDLLFADQLVAALELFGYSIIIDRKGISGAERWRERLGAMLLECDTVLFVLTPHSVKSDICGWEVDQALELKKRIVPVLASALEGIDPSEPLRELNYIKFYEEPKDPGSGWGSGLAQLILALSVDVDWVREHTRVGTLAERWERGGRNADLLVRGSELQVLQAWRDLRPTNAPELTKLQFSYLEASELLAEDTSRFEKERLEQMRIAQEAREEALSKAEFALEQAAQAHKKRARWRNFLFVVVVCGGAVTAWLLYVATEERREAELTLIRARQAERVAQKAEKDARTSALHAVVNEFMTSRTLLAKNPSISENIENYLDSGARMGFALVRNERYKEARLHFSKFRESLSSPAFQKHAPSVDFFATMIELGIASADAELSLSKVEEESARHHFSQAFSALRKMPFGPGLKEKWSEEFFRAYLYAVNLELESGNYEHARGLALEINRRLSAIPISDQSSARLLARSFGLLAWSSILSRHSAEALAEALRTNELIEQYDIADLADIRLNLAHALLLNDREDEARVGYKKASAPEIEKDFKAMIRAGFCFSVFEEFAENIGSCK